MLLILIYKSVEFKNFDAVRVFWDVAPFSQVEVDGRFRGAYCLHQGNKNLSTSTLLYGVTSQKTLNVMLAAVRT
jgi:hypothetical protein